MPRNRSGTIAGRAAPSMLCLLAVLARRRCLPGCYVMQAATGQADVLARSEPIEQVVADPARRRIRCAPGSNSCSRGAQVRRQANWRCPTAAASASTPTSDARTRCGTWWPPRSSPSTPLRWCYPVAGCVAYRGLFRRAPCRGHGAAARRGAATTSTVGGVATYSTLGHLPDPVFNTMLGWREMRLVGTIFHELAHERLYVPATASSAKRSQAWSSRRACGCGCRRGATPGSSGTAPRCTRGGVCGAAARGARAAGAAVRLARRGRHAACREAARVRSPQVRVHAAAGAAGAATRLRRMVRAHAQQRQTSPPSATYHDCVPGLRRELEAAGSLPAFYARAEELAALPPGRQCAGGRERRPVVQETRRFDSRADQR